MAAARRRAKKRPAKKASPKRSKAAARPRKVGRPTKRTADVEGQIERSLQNGMGINGAAAVAQVSRQTVHRWIAEDPEFATLCEKAQGLAQASMSAAVFAKGLKGDTTAMIWWQKCRDPEFREPREQPVNVDTGGKTGHELITHVLDCLAKQVTEGKVPVAVFRDVAEAMAKSSDVLERADLEQRIRKLEGRS